MSVIVPTSSMLDDATFVGTVLAAAIAAVIAVVLAYFQYRRQIAERKQAVTAALFAELAHIGRHYRISANEVSQCDSLHPVLRRLAWSKFGTVAASVNLKENAILGTQQMAEVLQLSLRIRNTDLFLDELLSRPTVPTQDELNSVSARMQSVATHAESLVDYLLNKDPSLKVITLK